MKNKKITINKIDVKNQTDMVLWHLKSFEHLTSFQAFKEYGITRLSAIIFTIRKDGYNITTKKESTTNRFNRNVEFGIYTYIPPINLTTPYQYSILDYTEN